MKPSPFLQFHRNRREGWYEFQLMAEPFMDGIIRKQWATPFHQLHRKGKHHWVVWMHGMPGPIFAGTCNECKQFVRLMWESMRQFH